MIGIVATPPVPLETCGKWTVTPAFVLRPGQPRVRRRPVRPPAAQPTQVRPPDKSKYFIIIPFGRGAGYVHLFVSPIN